MPKKRRLNDDQARLLAISYIQVCLERNEESLSHVIDYQDASKEYFEKILPPFWMDDNTSSKSWELLWSEMRLQLLVIMKGLDREALRIRIGNPDFRYTTQYPVEAKVKV